MTEKAQSRLYALTALACIIWLVQSTVEAVNDGSMWSIWNLFFTLALLIVIGWTGFNAVILMRKTDKEEEDSGESADSTNPDDSTITADTSTDGDATKNTNSTNNISQS